MFLLLFSLFAAEALQPYKSKRWIADADADAGCSPSSPTSTRGAHAPVWSHKQLCLAHVMGCACKWT